MYYVFYPYYGTAPMYNYQRQQSVYWTFQPVIEPVNRFDQRKSADQKGGVGLEDHGGHPFVININEAARQNSTFRTAIWTGKHLQVTVMSINVGEDIGLEVHPATDQFLRIEEGQGIVQMGDTKEHLNFEARVHEDDAIMVPAGTWHNVTNTGNKPLKLYSIYAPPEHPFGTVQMNNEAPGSES